MLAIARQMGDDFRIHQYEELIQELSEGYETPPEHSRRIETD